jgi:probable HAF family extracellular repeat protein
MLSGQWLQTSNKHIWEVQMHAKFSAPALLAMGGLLIVNPSGAQVHQSYTFTDLGTLGGRNSIANAVNDTGEIVGQSNPADSSYYRAIVWNGTIPTELPIAVSGRSAAYDINNRGEIVGNELFGFPTLWNGTEAKTLATPGNRGYAYAINNRGQVAGRLDLPHSEGSRAVVWNGTKLTELDAVGTYNSARAINNRGQAAGSSDFPSGYNHAVLWNGTAATDLGTLGGHSSFAYAINNRGQLVGSSNVNPEDDNLYHATIWNGTHATDLGTLGGPSSFAYSINTAGLVVGTSDIASPTHSGERHATLWDDGTAIDLNGFLSAETVNEGWVLTEANDINNKGWIVGSASNYLQGVALQAFLLTPSDEVGTARTVPMMLTAVPEPETYAMFLAGLGLIAGTLLSRHKAA